MWRPLEIYLYDWWPVRVEQRMLERLSRMRVTFEVDLALRAHQDLTLGSHSWGHPNLTCLSGQDLQDELTQPIRWLRDRWPGRSIPWLAYPYGLESQGVRLAASTAGYRGGLRVTGGWSRDEGNPFAFPRLNVSSGLSLNGFRARLAGFLIQ